VILHRSCLRGLANQSVLSDSAITDVCSGSLAVIHCDITPMAAFGGKADTRHSTPPAALGHKRPVVLMIGTRADTLNSGFSLSNKLLVSLG
jgi:hypothetical protein